MAPKRRSSGRIPPPQPARNTRLRTSAVARILDGEESPEIHSPREESPEEPEEPIEIPPAEDEDEAEGFEEPDADEADAEITSPPMSAKKRPKSRLRGSRGGRTSDRGTPDTQAEASSDQGQSVGPGRPRRGRGGFRGFRGRGRGSNRGPSHVTRLPLDAHGNELEIEDDEVVLPEEPAGEAKVNKQGHLLGGREYRVRTFTIADRDGRLYMLSTEPARCIGFRDSYLFFNKHPNLFKIIIEEHEKHDLIDRGILPHSYKGRAIGVVTARSVFREFGAKIVVGGKKVTDDYQEDAARERGDKEGELVDPNDRLPAPGEEYNRNQYVAWHGASQVYHTNAPSVPLAPGRPPIGHRRKVANITSANWMFEHALAASRFNSVIGTERRRAHAGVYDPHTNLMMYPTHLQPTHARWELVADPEDELARMRRKLAKLKSPTLLLAERAHGLNAVEDTSQADVEHKASSLPKPSNMLSRNFLIVDTVYQSAPFSTPQASLQHDWNGSSGLPHLNDEDLDDLPEECKASLLQAQQQEKDWKAKWGTEGRDGLRGDLKIGVFQF